MQLHHRVLSRVWLEQQSKSELGQQHQTTQVGHGMLCLLFCLQHKDAMTAILELLLAPAYKQSNCLQVPI